MEHTRGKAYKCELCPHATSTTAALKLHVKNIHLKDQEFECALCKYQTNMNIKLRKHIANFHNLSCHLCSLKFTTQEEVKQHYREKHMKAKKFKKCPDCDFKSMYSNRFYEHVRNMHSFECQQCSKKMGSRDEYTKHNRTYHPDKVVLCELCGRELQQKSLRLHMKKFHSSKSHKCNHCDYATGYKAALSRHVRERHSFTCQHCSKKMESRNDYFKHLNTEHGVGLNRIQRVKCDQCDKTLSSKQALQQHVQQIHIREELNPVKCDQCNKTFSISTLLQRHVQRMHSFICEYCSQQLESREAYVEHFKTHDERERISCTICAKVIQRKSLKRHMMVIHS